jgi:hypothetical protein
MLNVIHHLQNPLKFAIALFVSSQLWSVKKGHKEGQIQIKFSNPLAFVQSNSVLLLNKAFPSTGARCHHVRTKNRAKKKGRKENEL